MFDWGAPSGASNRPSDGRFVLSWWDFTLTEWHLDVYVASEAIRPYAQYELPSEPSSPIQKDISLLDLGGSNELEWSTVDREPGCYQPFGLLRGLSDTYLVVAPGIIAVSADEAAWPAIWIRRVRAPTDPTSRVYTIEVDVDDPDSATTVRVSYALAASAQHLTRGIETLELPQGGGTSSILLDLTDAEPGDYAFYAQVTAADDAQCAVFWPAWVRVGAMSEPPDDSDGGQDDASAPDRPDDDATAGAAGVTTTVPGSDGFLGRTGDSPRGCGCSTLSEQGASWTGWLAFAELSVTVAWLRWQRRPRKHARTPSVPGA